MAVFRYGRVQLGVFRHSTAETVETVKRSMLAYSWGTGRGMDIQQCSMDMKLIDRVKY